MIRLKRRTVSLARPGRARASDEREPSSIVIHHDAPLCSLAPTRRSPTQTLRTSRAGPFPAFSPSSPSSSFDASRRRVTDYERMCVASASIFTSKFQTVYPYVYQNRLVSSRKHQKPRARHRQSFPRRRPSSSVARVTDRSVAGLVDWYRLSLPLLLLLLLRTRAREQTARAFLCGSKTKCFARRGIIESRARASRRRRRRASTHR